MLRYSHFAVAMSRQQQAWLAAAGCRVRLIYNAVLDVPEAEPSRSSTPSGLAGLSPPLIGTIGRLSHEKGVDILLSALADLVANGLSFTVVIAGDGPMRSSLQRKAVLLGLTDRIRFLGHLDDVPSLLANLDLLVIPSRSEGLPNVLLEALHADVPVVATRVGAITNVLEAHRAGILVDPAPVPLSRGIREALSQTPSHFRAGRQAARVRFALDRRVQEIHDLYLEALSPMATTDPASSGTDLQWQESQ